MRGTAWKLKFPGSPTPPGPPAGSVVDVIGAFSGDNGALGTTLTIDLNDLVTATGVALAEDDTLFAFLFVRGTSTNGSASASPGTWNSGGWSGFGAGWPGSPVGVQSVMTRFDHVVTAAEAASPPTITFTKAGVDTSRMMVIIAHVRDQHATVDSVAANRNANKKTGHSCSAFTTLYGTPAYGRKLLLCALANASTPIDEQTDVDVPLVRPGGSVAGIEFIRGEGFTGQAMYMTLYLATYFEEQAVANGDYFTPAWLFKTPTFSDSLIVGQPLRPLL